MYLVGSFELPGLYSILTLGIHCPTDEPLHCFQFGIIMNKAVVNSFYTIFLWLCVPMSPGQIPRVEKQGRRVGGC